LCEKIFGEIMLKIFMVDHYKAIAPSGRLQINIVDSFASVILAVILISLPYELFIYCFACEDENHLPTS
jgi:hypothetical protein